MSTGHASPRSTWTSTSASRRTTLGELPALHAREGRGDHPGEGVPLPHGRHRRRAGRGRPLRRAPARHPLDLCCCGIGENGHLAFNDPPVADFDDPADVKIVALEPASRRQQVAEGHFATIDDVPTHAITVTIPALVRAGGCSRSCPRRARRFRCATRCRVRSRRRARRRTSAANRTRRCTSTPTRRHCSTREPSEGQSEAA